MCDLWSVNCDGWTGYEVRGTGYEVRGTDCEDPCRSFRAKEISWFGAGNKQISPLQNGAGLIADSSQLTSKKIKRSLHYTMIADKQRFAMGKESSSF